MSAEVGHKQSMFKLGLLYVDVAPKKAVEWLKRATDQGHWGAMAELGWTIFNKKIPGYTRTEGIELMERAAQSGCYPNAWNLLGRVFEEGRHVKVDAFKAYNCYWMAAAGGNLEGQIKIAEWVRTGNGRIEENPNVEACAWLAIAVESRHWFLDSEHNIERRIWAEQQLANLKPNLSDQEVSLMQMSLEAKRASLGIAL